MIKYLILGVVFLCSSVVNAQFIKGKSINVQIGYGLSSPNKSASSIVDKGFFAQGELVLKAASWVEFRPYLGMVVTNSNGKDSNDKPTDEKAESKAALLGIKTRVKAPVRWIAPYIELGIGTSIGRFETVTAFHNVDKNGIIYHIPFSFGLELGRNNNVDLSFTYYFQPSVKQFAGAFAVGIEIPLKSK